MDEQLYLELGEAISTLTGRTLAKVHPQLGVKVSPCGEVFLPQSGPNKAHWTFGSKNSRGYRTVSIGGNSYLVHRLVAQTFIPNPKNKPQVDHINRQKDQNSVDNLRWSTSHENCCNTAQHDRVTERGGTHTYEDASQYSCEQAASYRVKHPEKIRECHARYYTKNKDKVSKCHARYYAKNKDKVSKRHDCYFQEKRKTHRRVLFSDGSNRWIPLEEAEALLKLPLSQRIFKGAANEVLT